MLRRSLTQFESDLLMFPRTCGLATCSAHLGGGPAVVCGGCGVAVYCDKVTRAYYLLVLPSAAQCWLVLKSIRY